MAGTQSVQFKEPGVSGARNFSVECDLELEGKLKELAKVFGCFFGQICIIEFDPVDAAVKLQKKGMITTELMKDLMLSQASQQEKIIKLVDGLNEVIKSHPKYLCTCIKVMLEIDALKETAKEMLREAGIDKIILTIIYIHE